jgi:hypothetical protein
MLHHLLLSLKRPQSYGLFCDNQNFILKKQSPTLISFSSDYSCLCMKYIVFPTSLDNK